MIYLAPLQSYTNLFYIQAFNKYISGIDKYYTPFYRANKNNTYTIDKELNKQNNINIIPQVLCNSSKDLSLFTREIKSRNFDEINLNMGCPFPMLVNKQLGSGILPHTDKVKFMLDNFYNNHKDIKLSVKVRLGKENNRELTQLIDILNNYPILEIIIHPRLGIQKYKGEPDWESFAQYKQKFNFPTVGNGDINNINELKNKQQEFQWVKGWMLGRGLLTNPFLLQDIEYNSTPFWTKLFEFHQVFNNEISHLNDVQKLNLLKVFWEYPLVANPEGKRLHRKLRKLGVYGDYNNWYKLLKDSITPN